MRIREAAVTLLHLYVETGVEGGSGTDLRD
jgi:hypothetical protein